MFLEVKKLKKSFGQGENSVEVLKEIDFNVAKGEICVMLGPSGSGKSTLLNIIGGIDNGDEGYVAINGEKTLNMSEGELTNYRRKHLGYIFQMYNLIPATTMFLSMRSVTLPSTSISRVVSLISFTVP